MLIIIRKNITGSAFAIESADRVSASTVATQEWHHAAFVDI
jgi:hypothetical protein